MSLRAAPPHILAFNKILSAYFATHPTKITKAFLTRSAILLFLNI